MDKEYSCRIKQILEEGRRCKERLGVMGPTGPTGPTGPATITIGETTTGAPGTDATVTNTGTNQNAVLTFTIPAGATGPAGLPGPIGPTGPTGAAGAIGPQGIQGPTGPTGPTGPRGETISQTNTYGRKYDTTQTGITLEANISQDIPLGSNGPANGITLGTQNKLTIPTTGVYKVDYYFSGSASTNTEVTINLKQNATPIGSTTIGKNLTANVDTDFVGSTINAFTAGDQIGLSIESTDAATISPASDTSAYLNIVRIS